ncbi:hypothetical protein QQ045_026418 [Rhodiola kirilowii]
MVSGVGSPCGACKFLRRKCAPACLFAPYFCSEQGPARFAAIHKVFGASNVSKLLLHIPVQDRYEAVVTIAYEAQARLRDPVYGCVAHIFALQQQAAVLQAQLMQVKAQAQLASNVLNINNSSLSEWQGLNYTLPNLQPYYYNTHDYVSSQSSFQSMEHGNSGIDQEMKEEMLVPPYQMYSEQKVGSEDEELNQLPFRMMRSSTIICKQKKNNNMQMHCKNMQNGIE